MAGLVGWGWGWLPLLLLVAPFPLCGGLGAPFANRMVWGVAPTTSARMGPAAQHPGLRPRLHSFAPGRGSTSLQQGPPSSLRPPGARAWPPVPPRSTLSAWAVVVPFTLAAGLGIGLGALGRRWLHRPLASAGFAAAAPLEPQSQSARPADEMEASREFRRTVFFMPQWVRHRDRFRLFRSMWTIHRSRIVKRVVSEVLVVSLVSCLICFGQTTAWGVRLLTLPPSVFALSAPALGLLLVFRTNTSYGRWDEARRLFGLISARCMDLVRLASVRFPADPGLRAMLCRHAQALPYALKGHLRGDPGGCENDSTLEADLRPILLPKELQALLAAPHRPLYLVGCLTEIVRAAGLEGAPLLAAEADLTLIVDMIGSSERILRTPIPLSYTRLTARFLLLWLLLLPLGISGDIVRSGQTVWLTVPAVAFIAFLLLGIDEVGVQIEEPFSILPLEGISGVCKDGCAAFMAQHSTTAALVRDAQLQAPAA